MNEELLRFNNKQKYIIFDFETCNLNLASLDNKPWQLGFLLAQGKNILNKFNFLIRWDDLRISNEARKITGFNDIIYKNKAVDPDLVLKEFEKYLYDEDYLIIGHNILGFDIYIHNILRKNLNKKSNYSYLNRCIDTLSLAKAIKKDIKPDSGQDFLCWQYKLNSFFEKRMGCSIQALCKKYDIEFDVNMLHDALYDIELNFKIFNKQLWELEI